MGTRETQRLAWREAVARAAEEWWRARRESIAACRLATQSLSSHEWDVRVDAAARLAERARALHPHLLRALSAPTPWTRPAKADRGGWMLLTKCGVDDTEPCGACLREAGEALRRKRRAAQRGRR